MFKKYASIENSYNNKFINIVKGIIPKNEQFVISEKIHGANVSLVKWRDSKKIQLCKRTSEVKEDEKFYNCNVVLEELKQNNVERIFDLLFESDESIERINIFGEMFGGGYPHPDVEKSNEFSSIQKGVFYHPRQKVLFFDIMINGEYMSYEKLDLFIHDFELKDFFVHQIFSGNLDECLEFTNEFLTQIPNRFNLPNIENNICEGVVIKPCKNYFMKSGQRIIIKNKNERFTEISRKPKRIKTQDEIPEGIQKLCGEMSRYINENRFNAVVSKLGEITNKDFGKIAKCFSEDVLEEFEKENKVLNTLDDSEEKVIKKFLGKEISKFIRPLFLEITSPY